MAGHHGRPPSATGNQLGLLDMPGHWLEQLAGVLEPQSLLAMMRTGRPMRDMMLTDRPTYAKLVLPFMDGDASAVINKLQLACKYATDVHLMLQQDANNGSYVHACAYQLMHGAAERLALAAGNMGSMRALKAITNVRLTGLNLSGLVPAWLSGTCPNMTCLTLSGCRFSGLPTPTTAIQPCSQLKQLHVLGCETMGINDPTQVYQHQLRSLSSLNHLVQSCVDADGVLQGFQDVLTLNMCSAVGSQLTTLLIDSEWDIHPNPAHHTRELQQLAGWFSYIQELRLPGTLVKDEGMAALLSLPVPLQRLTCFGFALVQLYADKPSPYAHLTFARLDVYQFDRLPWEGVASLTELQMAVTPDNRSITAKATSFEATQRVTAVIARCGGVRWWPNDIVKINDVSDSNSLSLLLPMVASHPARHLVLGNSDRLEAWNITEAWLQALALQLSRQVQELQLVRCSWSPGVLPTTVRKLPASVQCLIITGKLSEPELTILCALACRPLELRLKVMPSPSDECLARVREAMTVAGHQHVRITVL